MKGKVRLLGMCILGVAVLAIMLSGAVGAKVQIRFAYPAFNPDREKMCQALVAAFEKKYPDIDVVTDGNPADFDKRIVVQYAGGAGPDVVWIWGQQYWSWAAAGILMDITKKFEAEKEIIADLWPNSLEYARYQGRLYGGPDSRLSAGIIHYNKDMFDQVGLEDPNDMDEAGRWTLDALVSAAKRLTRDTNGDGNMDTWALTFITGTFADYLGWFWLFDAKPFNEERTQCTIGSDPGAVKTLEWMYNLVYQTKVASTQLSWLDFQSGRLAIYRTGIWDWVWMRKLPFGWDVALMPKGPTGARWVTTQQQGGAYCILSTTKHPEEAWTFVKWLYSTEASKINCQFGEPPRRVSVAKTDLFVSGQPKHGYKMVEAMMKYARPVPYGPYWQDFLGIFSAEIKGFWGNKISASDVLKRIEDRTNAMIAEKNKKK